METRQKILITLMIGALLIFVFYIASDLITKLTGFSISGSEEDKGSDFAECLKKQDIFLYVKTSKDRNNIAQIIKNIQLYDYLEHIKIIDCFKNSRACLEKGIDSFPAWVVGENKINKDISLEELSMVSGCKL